MAESRRPQDIRKTAIRTGPRTGGGDGAAYEGGYGAGGLGSGTHQRRPAARPWDAPGVTPGGRRTGRLSDGPRIPHGEESAPDAAQPRDDDTKTMTRRSEPSARPLASLPRGLRPARGPH
jgi:hypothetical protein